MSSEKSAGGDLYGPLECIIDDLRRRFHGFPAPTEPIDPSKLDPEVLRSFGLPPKPDRAAPELLRGLWDRAFGKPLQLTPFVIERAIRVLIESADRLLARQADQKVVARTRFETSTNWSGAYITANRGRQFMQVWGYWTIPGNLKVPPAPFVGPPGIIYECSNWIGLDGQRQYLDSSLPQVGTASVLNPDLSTTAYTWTQWWAHNGTNIGPFQTGLPVSPGDQVLCVLTALDPQSVVSVTVNLSATPLPTAVVAFGTSPPVGLPDGTTVNPDIAGATAEWILERPRIEGSTTQYNFPDYGETEFGACVAVEANSVNIGAWATGVPQVLRGERLIRMFEVLDDPQRTTYVSMPRKVDDTTISVKFGGF